MPPTYKVYARLGYGNIIPKYRLILSYIIWYNTTILGYFRYLLLWPLTCLGFHCISSPRDFPCMAGDKVLAAPYLSCQRAGSLLQLVVLLSLLSLLLMLLYELYIYAIIAIVCVLAVIVIVIILAILPTLDSNRLDPQPLR